VSDVNQQSDDDQILWGAEQIGAAAEVLNADGSVNLQKTFRLIARGIIRAKKAGNLWVTTRGQARSYAKIEEFA